MIIVRPSAPFQMVCITDPGLDDIAPEKMVRYANDRDITGLELDKSAGDPTVFTCLPLMPEWEHLAVDPGPHEWWHLFATHVSAIKPAPVEIKWVTRHGDKVIDDDCRKLVPRDVVREVAETVIAWASADGDTVPFELPVTSWATGRTKRAALHAMNARTTTTASDEDSSS